MKAVIYEISTNTILSYVEGSQSFIDLNIEPGVSNYIEVSDAVSADTHYIDNGVVYARPARPAEYYDWNSTANQWDFNPTNCASYFLDQLNGIKDTWILSHWSDSTQKELAATAAFLLNEGKNSTTHCSEFKPFLDYYVNNENAKSALQIIYDAAIANITNPATSESARQSSIANALTAYYNDVNSYDPNLTTCP